MQIRVQKPLFASAHAMYRIDCTPRARLRDCCSLQSECIGIQKGYRKNSYCECECGLYPMPADLLPCRPLPGHAHGACTYMLHMHATCACASTYTCNMHMLYLCICPCACTPSHRSELVSCGLTLDVPGRKDGGWHEPDVRLCQQH